MLDWQLAVVGLIVTAAAAYLVRAGWRAWRGGKGGCGGGSCACPGKKAISGEQHIPLQQLTLRRRDSRGV